jgi:hypothetical protein
MDPAYYAKYSSTYLAFRQRVTNNLLQSVQEIQSGAKLMPIGTEHGDSTPADSTDPVKLESLGNSLSKLFEQPNLNRLGANAAGQRILEIVESYVRLLYSHYTFAKNLSVDTTSHPDMNLYMLVKATKSRPFAPLPPFPQSTNADVLLASLFQIIYDMASVGDENLNKLLKFIVDKMVTQQSKHLAYNVGKLRTTTTFNEDIELDDPNDIENEKNDVSEESLENLFAGYDIEEDDQEDNMNGEYT